MRLKSFRAASVAEAMQQVRDHFGENAVIVSTQRNPGGDGVRVTAAVEEPDAMEAAAAEYDPGPVDAVDAIDVVSQTLDFHGLPSALADRLLGISSNLLLDDPAAALAVALDAAISFEPLPAGGKPERPLMFVGPSGAGKTVTLAKLAVRAAFDRQPVHVITTDTLRAGGYDQLAAFTRLLKVELLQAEDPDQLRAAVGEATIDDTVLIDTVAVNPFNEADMAELAGFVRAVSAEPILVLPGGMDIAEAEEVGQAFRAVGCTRLLATRIDTTRRLGSIVNTACVARLKLCDYTHSPHVTQGLDKLNPLALARLMLPAIGAASGAVTRAGAGAQGYDDSDQGGATVDAEGRVEPAWARERPSRPEAPARAEAPPRSEPHRRPEPSANRPAETRSAESRAPSAGSAPVPTRTPPPRGAAGAYRAAPATPTPVKSVQSMPASSAPADDEAAAAALAAAIVAAAEDRSPTAAGNDDYPLDLDMASIDDRPSRDFSRFVGGDDPEPAATQAASAAFAQTDDDLLSTEWADPEDAGSATAVEPLEEPDFGDAEAEADPQPDFDALHLDDDFDFGDDSSARRSRPADRRTSDAEDWTSGDDLLESPAAAGQRFGKNRS